MPSKVEADVPESNEEVEIKTEEDIKEEPEEAGLKRNPRARLIVRNLSFKVRKWTKHYLLKYLNYHFLN